MGLGFRVQGGDHVPILPIMIACDPQKGRVMFSVEGLGYLGRKALHGSLP